jgi:hypothetical protein
MDHYVQTIPPDMDIMDAVDFLLRLLTHGDSRAETPAGKVRDFMTADVQSIPPTLDIYYCAGFTAEGPSQPRRSLQNGC